MKHMTSPTKSYSSVLAAAVAVALGFSACGTPRTDTSERVVTSRDGYEVTDYRRRPNEQVFEVPVSTVRAVVGPDEKRCWIERQQVSPGATAGGAVAGAIIGGILGHQIGRGRGQDAATIGGAVAGGAVGASAARRRSYDREVERCETVASTTPDYWDVTYEFRGVQHRVQMTSPPGDTITVNRMGEPRV